MPKLAIQYLEGVKRLIDRMVEEEIEALQEAAALMADAIASGHTIFAFGCTHSSLPIQDLVYRAGGLMLINPIFGPGIASLDVHPVTMSSAIERLEGYAEVLLDTAPIASGDVLILVSVSGRNAVPVEMAKLARERGIGVIGVTSRAYTQAFESRHSSGKRMYEFANVVLDNKADPGDASLELEGVPQKFCPVSGVTSTAILQALVAATVELLVERGIEPPVLLAANVDGSEQYNARMFEANRNRIHYL